MILTVTGVSKWFGDPPARTEALRDVSFSVEHDFGCGAIDWRGGYKNAGA